MKTAVIPERVQCFLCFGEAITSRKSGKLRLHGFWFSGRKIECDNKLVARDEQHAKELRRQWLDGWRKRRGW